MYKIFLKTFVIVAIGAFLSLSLTGLKAEKNEQPTEAAGEKDKVVFLETTNKDGSEKSFDQIMSQFKGKVVYVDFWASWCGPCVRQMPSAKELHGKMEGKEVAFLYISFDRTEGAWKNGIEKHGIQGYHLYPGDQLRNEIYTKFRVDGIPRYMIADRGGKIVDRDAPRPGETDKVAGLLNGFLKQN